MSSGQLRFQVFLSYSRRDSDTVKKVADRLRSSGLEVWIDTTGLEPGTTHWGNAIQEAINQSFAVVWVASPNGKASPYIKDEVDTAIGQGIAVIPAWIEGTNWHESAWLGAGQMQYIDCRVDKFESGIANLINKLKLEFDQRVPNYFIVDELPRQLPHTFLSIRIGRDQFALVNVKRYACVADLLRDIWEDMTPQPSPYTYGLDWLLSEEQYGYQVARVIAPIEWCDAYSKGKHITELYPNWSKKAALSDFHMLPQSKWRIVRSEGKNFHGIHGIVSKDPQRIDDLVYDVKNLQTMIDRQIVEIREFRKGDNGVIVHTPLHIETAKVVELDQADFASSLFRMLFGR